MTEKLQSSSDSTKTNYRLPKTVVPTHYDLYLHPDVETGNFTGNNKITINVLEETDHIILHSLNLEIFEISTSDDAGNPTISVKEHCLDLKREFLVIELCEKLKPCTMQLNIKFSGKMGGKMIGLYSSSYLKKDGSKKTIATSKFEPTYARQAYPCFDEPNMKATFSITLVTPTDGGYHALSNMSISNVEKKEKHNEVHFNKSVPMSTYLSCFIVSDFAYKEAKINTKGIGGPFHLRVYAPPEYIEKVDFALDVGVTVLECYIDYFQIEYPLPKMDMAAIPDFVSGAMENWGMVTYRETFLLYDKVTTSSSAKQKIASVIAHEFAHMWFGNLVTMNWWNDLWLNEGFARFIENKGVNAKFPEWSMFDQYLLDILYRVLSLDATLGSHPIIQTVENPDQITEIFDLITYSKGSAVIRMFENFVSPDIFREGVTKYLNVYKYKNAVTNEFLSIFNELVDIDVKAIMGTWLEQMGLPVVEIQRISKTEYKLTQKRFLENPKDYHVTHAASPFNYTWSIPITYTTSANSQKNVEWFYYDQKELTISLPNEVHWIKFNQDQIGYYRVNYSEEMWNNLATVLFETPNVFSVSDRTSILNDAFALADAEQLSYGTALDMTKYLEKELDYVPWSLAASKLIALKRTLMFTNTFKRYTAYARKLLQPIYKYVGWTPDKDAYLKNRLRIVALNAACSLGLEDCLSVVSKEFQKWLNNPKHYPHPDLRSIIFNYGMMHEGNEQIWEKVWKLFVDETDANEKIQLMTCLSSVQIPSILSRFVDLAWNEDNVRSQDYFACLECIAENPIGKHIIWDYVRENWPRIVKRFSLNDRKMGKMIPNITSSFASQTKLEELQNFFAKYPEAGAGTAARVQALEAVKNNVQWLEGNHKKISDWLEAQNLD